MDNSQYDLVIIGGGLAGASLGAALADSPLRIAVIERHGLDDSAQASFDERTVALTYSARLIYQQMALWQSIDAAAISPINNIVLSNQGHFGRCHLDASHAGTDALGYVIATRVLGQALHQRLQDASNIELICPAQVNAVNYDEALDEMLVSIESMAALRAKLVVIADGGRSPICAQLGLDYSAASYPQRALLCMVKAQRDHNGTAYERFTDHGPIALLPHTEQRFAAVWTMGTEQAARTLEYDDTSFIAALHDNFGSAAGVLSQPSKRLSYPLSHGNSTNNIAKRAVSIGNAAHIVHPVAGQGFNLGLRDVAQLAANCQQIHQHGDDIGSAAMLEQYRQQRQSDSQRVGAFTTGLIDLFAKQSPATQLARNLGLAALEFQPWLKREILTRSMGLHATVQPLRNLGSSSVAIQSPSAKQAG